MLCRFERSIYQSPQGYCVFSYTTTDRNVPEAAKNKRFFRDNKTHITAVGFALPATDSIEVDLIGTWEKSNYGLQFAVERYEQKLPKDTEKIIAYLCSGCIKGIGPSTAKAIVARFGTDTLDVMENDPEQLLTVKGIAQAKLRKIMKSYHASARVRDLTQYLSPYGVTMKKISKIYETFGENSLAVVMNDPFLLCKIRSFGFLTVDTIARKTKVSLKNPMRYAGAIAYCLEEAHTKGHLFLPQEELMDQCHELLNRDLDKEIVTRQEISHALSQEVRSKTIYNENGRVYLSFDRLCEVQVAKKIVAWTLNEHMPGIRNLAMEISTSERNLSQTLAPSQRNAVEVCLQRPCSIITGGPGTGKTTTLRVILDIYHRAFPRHEILLTAPTGKASRRMSEQTGFPAFTLHSALGILCENDIYNPQPDFLSADFVVVDEASMVDVWLAYALVTRLKPGVKLLLVGDPDQLPAVGPGNVLRELIRSGTVPTAVLDKVFRQASNSRIYMNAYAVNHDDTKLLYGDDFIMEEAGDAEEAAALVMKHFFEESARLGMENVQILSPFRKRGLTCSNSLNTAIREMVNPPRRGIAEIKCGAKIFREGDRIIQLKNSAAVANGDMGTIEKIETNEDNEQQVHIKLLDGRELLYDQDDMEDVDLAFSISIHKSQGAEFPCVIIPLLKEHYIMLRRNLLYTAISRAKGKVILVGQRQAVFMAIHKSDVDKRNTVLADRIVAYYEREAKQRAVKQGM